MARATLNNRFVEFAEFLLGPVFFFIARVGQRYSDKRQLRKCSRVGLRVHAGYGLIIDGGGNIFIADDVSFSRNSLLSSYKGGSIKIGANCFFGDNLKVVSDVGHIEIGDDCLIAENVSIRTSNHGTKPGILMRLQSNPVKDTRIGKDCWLGSGVAVLAGSHIADGCVIGANSVVRGTTEPNSIYAGAPARKIKNRGEELST